MAGCACNSREQRIPGAAGLLAVALVLLPVLPASVCAAEGASGQKQHSTSVAKSRTRVEAVAANVSVDGEATVFTLDLSSGVGAEVFTLANPYRVIVDLPDVAFNLPAEAGQKGAGVVSAYRYGLFADQKGRVVLDTTGPVFIKHAGMEAAANGKGVRLTVRLVPTDAASFGAGTGAGHASAPPETKKTERNEDVALPGAPKVRAKPVVMIDPGHGGIDPGALGTTKLLEKTVVLAVGQRLRDTLKATGRYDVYMTRSKDVFVSLDKRLNLSQERDADLFISIHADAIAGSFADTVRGATVYTLSERASDEQARRMAEKENASDALAGLESVDVEEQDDVRNILFDLLKRETANFSADFAKSLVGRLGKTIALSRDPQRSAAFKVLKQTHAPSVLIELGYMSNAEDERLMNTPAWQKKVAASITAAVDAYFTRRLASGK
jgi:N-acetylmuramoyl-L-alanine amidase